MLKVRVVKLHLNILEIKRKTKEKPVLIKGHLLRFDLKKEGPSLLGIQQSRKLKVKIRKIGDDLI